MSSILLLILTVPFFFNLLFCDLTDSNLTGQKEENLEIANESISEHFIIKNKNQGESNTNPYYVNDKREIINALDSINMNSKKLCSIENKCSFISEYIFEKAGIRIFPEQDFSKKLPCNDGNDDNNYKCNNEVHINENIKCMCCKIETPEFIKNENYKEEDTICTNYNQFNFSKCKCILKYDVDNDNITTNKCETFTCNNGLCALKVNGEPFCSCFDHFYFDIEKDACIKHEEKECNTQSIENIINPENNPLDISEYTQEVSNHENISSLTSPLLRDEKESKVAGKSKDMDDACINNQTGNKNEKGEKIDNTEESVCLRVECFNDFEKSECFCVDKNGEKIGSNIFDVSNISICTLNNVVCDNGICNNSLKKEELRCICDKNYIYDDSLKVCISSSLKTFLNFLLIFTIFTIMSILNLIKILYFY